MVSFWFISLCPSPPRLPVQLPLPVYGKELWVRDHSLLPKSLPERRLVRSHRQRFHLQLQKWPDRSNVSDPLQVGNGSFSIQWWRAFWSGILYPKAMIHLAKNNPKLSAYFKSKLVTAEKSMRLACSEMLFWTWPPKLLFQDVISRQFSLRYTHLSVRGFLSNPRKPVEAAM